MARRPRLRFRAPRRWVITPLPKTRGLDDAVSVLRDPHGFISDRARELGSDLFETRIALRRVICLTGAYAASLFYDEQRFVRAGAMPEPVGKTVFGQGGVQALDGAPHRYRKTMLLSLTTPERVAELTRIASAEWQKAARAWTARDRVVLYDEVRNVIARAVCRWAGVPVDVGEMPRRAHDLALLFEGVIPTGPKHVQARLARGRLERWVKQLIGAVRDGRLQPAKEGALEVIAGHRHQDGRLLPPNVAAVELLNILRPTVTVAVWVTFGALALHRVPAWRARFANASDADREAFAQEVRRFFPFAPFVPARVREPFDWNGFAFPAGRMALLDLYGTNHDRRIWGDPERFRPERFLEGRPGPFEFIPQGGGDAGETHRCAGEWPTVELLKQGLAFLAGAVSYEVPDQDLRIVRSAVPPLPRSRFVLADVRVVA